MELFFAKSVIHANEVIRQAKILGDIQRRCFMKTLNIANLLKTPALTFTSIVKESVFFCIGGFYYHVFSIRVRNERKNITYAAQLNDKLMVIILCLLLDGGA